MKTKFLTIMICILLLTSCNNVAHAENNNGNNNMVNDSKNIVLKIDGNAVDVVWEDNDSVKAIKEIVKNFGLKINTHQYGGFEQVGEIGQSIVSKNVQMTTEPGDIVLYAGNNIVVFYGNNSWSYTKLGKIVGKTNEELKNILNKNNTVLEFSAMEKNQVAKSNLKPAVYFTKDITADSLVKIYEKLSWTPTGKVGVKISTGEPPKSNYLRADLIGGLVKKVNGTIIECNTAYGGQRASTALHKQVAKDHGYTEIAEVDILDEDGDLDLPVAGGKRLTRLITGTHLPNYQSVIVLSHFKGHQMAGYGGAIKNVGIGMSSASGKVLVHTAGTKTSGSIFYDDQDAWLEAMAEMTKGMSDYYDNGKRMTYINVMNRISIDCDCNGNPAEPDIHDIGILASNDPVALDQACLDLVYKADGREALVNRINRQHGEHTLEHAVEIGLGSREYELVSID